MPQWRTPKHVCMCAMHLERHHICICVLCMHVYSCDASSDVLSDTAWPIKRPLRALRTCFWNSVLYVYIYNRHYCTCMYIYYACFWNSVLYLYICIYILRDACIEEGAIQVRWNLKERKKEKRPSKSLRLINQILSYHWHERHPLIWPTSQLKIITLSPFDRLCFFLSVCEKVPT